MIKSNGKTKKGLGKYKKSSDSLQLQMQKNTFRTSLLMLLLAASSTKT
jgi:hypothetical protein